MAGRSAFSALQVPICRAGWPFIAGFLVVSVLLGFLWLPLFWIGLVLSLWCVYFFRDPRRVAPVDPALVLSPADGVVQATGERRPPPELGLGEEPLRCVSIFLNVLDVHVNRTPVAGRIVRKAYHPGRFLNAAADKASDVNERQSFRIRTEGGLEVGLVQIAGLVARRIVGYVEEGALVGPGDRVGLIRFGSRCDVYLPAGVAPIVIPGQRAVGGETVIAHLVGPQSERMGRET